MKPFEFTLAGWPAVGGEVLETLAGDPAKGKWGKAMEHFPTEEAGKCVHTHTTHTHTHEKHLIAPSCVRMNCRNTYRG